MLKKKAGKFWRGDLSLPFQPNTLFLHSISLVEKWYRIDNHENHLKCEILLVTIKKGGLEKVI